MKNGDALTAFTIDAQNVLDNLNVLDYFAQDLPSETDGAIGGLIGRFMSLDSTGRERFQQTMSKSQRALFGIYGHRAATLAARLAAPQNAGKQNAAQETEREATQERLLNGLVGAAIANYTIPVQRRVEVALAVYHHVARRLGLNPIDVFEDAAVYAGETIAPIMLAFGRRDDVTLSSFGWRELQTPQGVKYKFEWA